MRLALCRAVARCQARRLQKLVAGAPLPAATVAALVAPAPFALARVGSAIGNDVAGAIDAGQVANALVLGPMLAAAMAGAALAAALPGRAALGQHVAAGPVSDTGAVLAGLLVPSLLAAVAVLPQIAAVCIALGAQLPGGRVAGAGLACATCAAVPAGAIVVEGALAASRGRCRRSLAIVVGGLAWAVLGVVFGAAALGPFAPVGAALAGTGSAGLALAVAFLAAVVLACGWVLLAARRPERRVRGAKAKRRLVRGGQSSVPLAVVALLARRNDVRLAAAAALAFGVAGIGIAVATAAPAPTPFLLGTTTALLGSILVSLAACGVLLEGRWLWIGAPRDRSRLALTACLVGVVGSAVPVAAVGAGAAIVSGASASTVGIVTVLVIVGSAAALQAGALVPWSGAGIGDQLTTFAVLAAVAIAMSLVVGLVAPRLVAFGLPDALVAALLCAASLGVAFLALGRRLEVAAR